MYSSTSRVLSYPITGHDMDSLLYNLLNELLMLFCIDKLVCKQVKILAFDRDNWTITAEGKGERWSRAKHTQGTEIKVEAKSCAPRWLRFSRPSPIRPCRSTKSLTRPTSSSLWCALDSCLVSPSAQPRAGHLVGRIGLLVGQQWHHLVFCVCY